MPFGCGPGHKNRLSTLAIFEAISFVLHQRKCVLTVERRGDDVVDQPDVGQAHGEGDDDRAGDVGYFFERVWVRDGNVVNGRVECALNVRPASRRRSDWRRVRPVRFFPGPL